MRTYTGFALACSLLAACGGTNRPLNSEGVVPGLAPDGSEGEATDAGMLSPDPADSGVTTDAGAPGAGAPDAGVHDAGAPPPAPPAAPAGPSLGGCPMFPAGNIWNRNISGDPVDARSADYLAFMGADSLRLHPDFGAPEYGEPFVVVSGSQHSAPVTFTYSNQSDPGPYPFPADLPIQAGADHHATVLDKERCLLYETFMTARSGSGFSADSGAVFNLRTGALRPEGWTSATASGLPVLLGLARYDEAVERGEIRHALAFTAGASAHFYVRPATHSSGTSGSWNAPPLGLRVRLRAGYDLSNMHGTSLVIARALQRYGMFLIDNANDPFWSLAGGQDPRWPTQDLEQLKSVPASAFEVVKMGELIPGQ